MDGTEIMGKRVQVSKSTNVSYDTFYGFLSVFRTVPVVVAVEAAAVAHAVEVLQDVVVANGHTEHNTLLPSKIFPAVASTCFPPIPVHLTLDRFYISF